MSTPLLCPLPWHSLAVRNDGYYRVCCHANVSGTQGLLYDGDETPLNAGSDGLDRVRNSDTLKQIRRELLDGKWPAACSRCLHEESVGLRSKRIYANERVPVSLESLQQGTSPTGEIQTADFPLRELDLRFGNKCNLKCRMCGPSDSSSWYEDFEKLHGVAYKAPGDLQWYEQSQFWQDLESGARTIEHIYVVGGEPLLIDQHYDFLQYLIDKNQASQITLEYNTNLTVLPEKALQLWRSFRQIRVGISIDAHGRLNDYIRHPSKFQILERNMHRLDQAEAPIVAWIACTVSILNFYDLSDLMIWKIKQNFKRINSRMAKPLLTAHVLHKPHHLSLQCLPTHIKDTLNQEVPLLFEKFQQDLNLLELTAEQRLAFADKWTELYQSLLGHMTARDLSDNFEKFWSFTEKLDLLRQQNLSECVSPRYFEILKNV